MSVFNPYLMVTSYFWGSFFIITGLILALTGIRYSNLSTFFINTVGTFFLIGLLAFDFFLNETDEIGIQWVGMVITLVAAPTIGFFMQ